MAWISVHEQVIGPKLRRLARKIGCSPAEALGILNVLWFWGLKNADKSGELLEATQKNVCAAIPYDFVREDLSVENIVSAIIRGGWIDENGGSLFLHDWEEWQTQWYAYQGRKAFDAERKRRERSRERETKESSQERLEDTEAETPTDSPKDEDGPEAEEPKLKYAKAFDEFWKRYPRKIDKGNAYKKWVARLNDGYSEEELITAGRIYADRCSAEHTEEKYIKHPKTFLSDACPFLDFLPKQPEALSQDEGGNPFKQWGGDDE